MALYQGRGLEMDALGMGATVLVAALLSVGLVQALIGLVKRFGVKGPWLNVYAIVAGVGLALLAKWVFPEALEFVTYAQVAVFGGLNGLSTTVLWEFRRGK
jgi:hypothetical protein